MNIFILRIDDFLNFVDKSSITDKFTSKKRCIEYSFGRFLVDFVAKNFYGFKDTELVVEGNKPRFLNREIFFSISHSKNIVAVAFDESDIGFDIEEIRPRNFEKLSKFLDKNFKNEIEFYSYWTQYEAEYKSSKQFLETFRFGNYMCSVSFAGINTRLNMYELVIPKNKTCPSELINLKLVNDSNKNDNAVEIKEINTAILEFLPPPSLNIEQSRLKPVIKNIASILKRFRGCPAKLRQDIANSVPKSGEMIILNALLNPKRQQRMMPSIEKMYGKRLKHFTPYFLICDESSF